MNEPLSGSSICPQGAFVDALQRTAIHPSESIPVYATIGKLRLFASNKSVEAADQVMQRIVETYYAPQFNIKKRPTIDEKSDIIREFTEPLSRRASRVRKS